MVEWKNISEYEKKSYLKYEKFHLKISFSIGHKIDFFLDLTQCAQTDIDPQNF